jgi:catechol 2,3-dioxygenase-like lactoylglutathione lyase family enzyme
MKQIDEQEPSMLGYATLGTNDVEKSTCFYDEVLKPLGARRVFAFERGVYYGTRSMELGILTPVNGDHATVGNGSMVALHAPDHATVDEVHATAIRLGGANEGDPGFRGDSSIGFYGAYFRDLDGNKLCVFNISPPSGATEA